MNRLFSSSDLGSDPVPGLLRELVSLYCIYPGALKEDKEAATRTPSSPLNASPRAEEDPEAGPQRTDSEPESTTPGTRTIAKECVHMAKRSPSTLTRTHFFLFIYGCAFFFFIIFSSYEGAQILPPINPSATARIRSHERALPTHTRGSRSSSGSSCASLWVRAHLLDWLSAE